MLRFPNITADVSENPTCCRFSGNDVRRVCDRSTAVLMIGRDRAQPVSLAGDIGLKVSAGAAVHLIESAKM